MSIPIASRQYTYDGEPLQCRFCLPVADRTDYYCEYEIDWPTGMRSRKVYGIDAVQALVLAMKAAHTDLLMARKDHGVSLQWLDMQQLGLPMSSALQDLDPSADI